MTRPRNIRAPICWENPAQTPAALNEPIVKNRRRENPKILFFKRKLILDVTVRITVKLLNARVQKRNCRIFLRTKDARSKFRSQ